MIALPDYLLYAQSTSCDQWDVQDILYKASGRIEQPFDLTFGARIRHESGVVMTVPGFYDGDNTWILRFCPTLPGIWTYRTYAGISSLAGKTGRIEVRPNAQPDRHGAIVLSRERPDRFEYEDGTAWFPLAFEIDWLFALDAGNPADIPRTRQIAGHMADNGFNKAIMNVYAYDASWGEREKIDPKYNFAKPEVFPFGGSNGQPDHSTLNVDFFRHFDRVMAHLYEKGIASHLMIYVWNKQVNWPKPGSAEDNRYFDYVVKRYQAFPNLLWDISKEALAYGMDDMEYIVSRIERLRRLDGHRRLVTVHDYSFCKAYPGLIDFVSIQEWRPNLYDEMRKVAAAHPGMPVFNVEHGAYEQTMHTIFHGAYVDSVVCLERSYLCLFAGTYTTYYWQNSSWYELVYEPFSLPADNQPKFGYYKIMSDFFGEYDFDKLESTQYLYSPYVLTDKHSIALYLMPRGVFSLEGMAPPFARNRKITVQWFDPLSGVWSEKEERTTGEWTGFRKPAGMPDAFCIAVLQLVEHD